MSNSKVIVSSGVAGWAYTIRTGKHCEYVIVELSQALYFMKHFYVNILQKKIILTDMRDMIYFEKQKKEHSGVRTMLSLVLVKRETGGSPVRTRHRDQGVKADKSLGNWEDSLSVDL